MTTDLDCAIALLKKGDLVGMPTETVYGLAADALSPKAMAAIYARKGRPSFNPLIIHTYSLAKASEFVEFNDAARVLAERFWPGPLTLVLQRSKDCAIDLLASAGLPTLAVRVPNHPVALALLRGLDRPVAAPSANLSNHISPTTRAMVLGDFPDLFVLEGGPATIGLESTIIGFNPDPILYRPGGIAIEDIEGLIGPIKKMTGEEIHAPGMQKKHYAPRHNLRLNALSKNPGEVLLGFGILGDADLNLSVSGCVIEAASHLFSMLSELDQRDCAGIAVSPIPTQGLGAAINDRLRRGAS